MVAPPPATSHDVNSSARFSGVARLFRRVVPRKLRLQKNKNKGKTTASSNDDGHHRVVSFALDKNGHVPSHSVHTYEAPPRADHPLLFFTKDELAEMSQTCEALANENKGNQEYLSNLGRIIIDNGKNNSDSGVPSAELLSGEEGSSSFDTLSSSFSSSLEASCLPDSEALEHMRGLEHLIEEQAGAYRRSWVQSILRYQEKLRQEAVNNEEKASLLSRKSRTFSQDSSSLALKLAEWDALEAARVHRTQN